jgi:beta-alanine--pyruvate transaminase
MAPLDMKPNELEPYWVPFTANRAFKKRPRLFAGAKGLHYFKPDGSKVIDATSGLFCVNAGHCRAPIVQAIQDMAARLDYAPAFQYGHPKVFELASRLALLAPGDLDYAFFSNSGSEAVDTATIRRGARVPARASSAASAAITALALAASRSAASSPTASSSVTC